VRFTAEPPSPEKPAVEVPAIRLIVPVEFSLKTHRRLMKQRVPAESAANPLSTSICMVLAEAGVAGGEPPATVEIRYCCALQHEMPARRIVTHGSAEK